MASPVFITNDQVKSVLTWPLVHESIEEAFKSVVVRKDKSLKDQDQPNAQQKAKVRTSTPNNGASLATMPGYIGNHKVTLESGDRKTFQTLACKLVTRSPNNIHLKPPIPRILANILLFDEQTGQLECVMDGTLITAWRTASASVVATKYLYFGRKNVNPSDGVTLALIGCGVQGESHALGMCTEFKVNEIRLLNRTASKAVELSAQLDTARKTFVNPNPIVTVCPTIGECFSDADIVVTSTQTEEPLVHLEMLKKDVHINGEYRDLDSIQILIKNFLSAVGASVNSYSELGQDIYDVAPVYIEYWAGAKADLADLKTNIVCEVGEVILGSGKCPENGISVFHSMGMAVEDAAVVQAVYQNLKKK
ncbi:ketimine reductase mu-crystallin-like [Episyrphus balteatus]|uniref:ketimine reductase mu-crystallin-like n=1 Tax=Episyrphus balteatus TaxID=286459 RepID=UPI0024854F43|nr:ketimine reductase mu-crystallin-like [Episyrphus balteatus]